MTEEGRVRKVPKWYNPNDPLLVFVDGPRDREWMTQSRFDHLMELAPLNGEFMDGFRGRIIGYRPTGGAPIPHPKDDRITGIPMTWVEP